MFTVFKIEEYTEDDCDFSDVPVLSLSISPVALVPSY